MIGFSFFHISGICVKCYELGRECTKCSIGYQEMKSVSHLVPSLFCIGLEICAFASLRPSVCYVTPITQYSLRSVHGKATKNIN